ncbi:hypothetical protein TNCV_5037571 [Trichonephila clavipes]|nr:hypothetical protein TNCV_5037571 [Trichonephila clavipes]
MRSFSPLYTRHPKNSARESVEPVPRCEYIKNAQRTVSARSVVNRKVRIVRAQVPPSGEETRCQTTCGDWYSPLYGAAVKEIPASGECTSSAVDKLQSAAH